MKNLKTAIFNELTGSSLNQLVRGGIYKGRADKSARYPYIVFSIVSDDPTDTFKSKIDNPNIQFSLFSDNSSDDEIEEMYDKLKQVMDDAVLNITGATQCLLYRENTIFADEDVVTPDGTKIVWHYAVDYSMTMERT